MKYPFLVAAALACAFSAAPARAQSFDQQAQLCNNDNRGGTPPAQGIAACTAMFNSDRVPASALGLLHSKRGRFYLFNEDYPRAIADFNEAIKLKSDDRVAFYNRGQAKRMSGDNDGAVADVTEAMRLGLNGADVFSARGQAYAEIGDYSRAIADFSDALRINPQDTFSYIDRGDAYRMTKDYARAIADYDAAIRIDPQQAFSYFDRGLAKLQQGNYADAFADFSAAVKIEPNEAVYQYARGLAAQKLGRAGESQADIAKAKTLNPDVEKNFASVNATSTASSAPSSVGQVASHSAPAVSPAELGSLGAGELFAKADELDQQGKADEARIVRRTLIERFPDSPLAAEAAKQLSAGGNRPFNVMILALAAGCVALLALVGFGVSRLFRRKAKSAPAAADEKSTTRSKGKVVPLLALGGGVAAATIAAFLLWPHGKGTGTPAPTENADASSADEPDMCSPIPKESVPIEQRIAACTAAIKSGQTQGAELARLYQYRGLFYVNPQNPNMDRASAVADFSEAIKLDPQSAGNYTARAGSLIVMKEYDRAIADANAAIRLTDTTAEASFFPHATLGKVYIARKDYQAAIATFNQVIEIADHLENTKALGQAQGFYGRGIAELRLGREAAGQADVAKAKTLFENVENFFVVYGMTPEGVVAAAPSQASAAPAKPTPTVVLASSAAAPTKPAPTAAPASSAEAPARSTPTADVYLDNVNSSYDPDWNGYLANNSTPVIVVTGAGQKRLLSILVMNCSDYSFTRDTPECKAGQVPTQYKVVVDNGSGNDAITDCPNVTQMRSCDPLWREKGAEIIALARKLRSQ